MKERWISEITLNGNIVILKPLSLEDESHLIDAAKDGKLWELTFTSVPESHNAYDYIKKAITEYQNGLSHAFAVVNIKTKKVIGTTRFTNLDPINKRLEIGYTWYAKSYQGTKVNKECKLLLLTYAFDQLKCIAVEFRTHHQNLPSQKSIEMLGAKRDGILRSHQIDRSGQIRNTIVYSILSSEWPAIEKRLKRKIQ